MANRAYLYSLSSQPTSYTDRPESISGLSEWPYDIPLSYRVLMSGNPTLCASLVSDGFDGEPADQKTRLYAISSEFDAGYQRLTRLIDIVRQHSDGKHTALDSALDETLQFLDAHRDRFVLLETIELDTMMTADEAELRRYVEEEIERCRQVGEAIDLLPQDLDEAAAVLAEAASNGAESALDAFFGMRMDDDFDNVRDDMTEYPLGMVGWYETLYFQLWNKAEFDARNNT